MTRNLPPSTPGNPRGRRAGIRRPLPSDRRKTGSGGGPRLCRVFYVRASAAEVETVRRRALDAGLSMARYLVHCATAAKAPPTREERARLGQLDFALRRGALLLSQLLTLSFVRQSADAESLARLVELQHLLEQLAREVERRM